MPDRSTPPYLRTLTGVLAGCAGFTVLGALIGRGIAAVGDPTAAAVVPVVVCAACGFAAGGAFGANVALQRDHRSRAGAAATVVFVALVIVMVASAAIATSGGLPVFALLPVGPLLGALLAAQIAGPAQASPPPS